MRVHFVLIALIISTYGEPSNIDVDKLFGIILQDYPPTPKTEYAINSHRHRDTLTLGKNIHIERNGMPDENKIDFNLHKYSGLADEEKANFNLRNHRTQDAMTLGENIQIERNGIRDVDKLEYDVRKYSGLPDEEKVNFHLRDHGKYDVMTLGEIERNGIPYADGIELNLRKNSVNDENIITKREDKRDRNVKIGKRMRPRYPTRMKTRDVEKANLKNGTRPEHTQVITTIFCPYFGVMRLKSNVKQKDFEGID